MRCGSRVRAPASPAGSDGGADRAARRARRRSHRGRAAPRPRGAARRGERPASRRSRTTAAPRRSRAWPDVVSPRDPVGQVETPVAGRDAAGPASAGRGACGRPAGRLFHVPALQGVDVMPGCGTLLDAVRAAARRALSGAGPRDRRRGCAVIAGDHEPRPAGPQRGGAGTARRLAPGPAQRAGRSRASTASSVPAHRSLRRRKRA